MKAALFCTSRYMGPATQDSWPVPSNGYSPEIAARSMQTTLDQFRRADEVGFDWVTLAEHHFAPFSMTPNPMVMAGALTQIVKNAKIALLGPDVPILNPVRLAEEFAMLDTMTGGRVIAGMMRGTPNEYVTYNVNPSESRARFAEALKLIKMAWTEPQPFGWQGRFYEYRSISIWPRPVQKPHPPLYMSGSSPESGEFAAKNRIGLGFAFTTLPIAIPAAEHYRKCAREAGWEPTPDDVIYRVNVHCAETDDQAIEDAKSVGGGRRRTSLTMANAAVEHAVDEAGYYGRDRDTQRARLAVRDFDERVALGQLLIGGPETIVKQIKRIRDELGAGILDLTLALQLGEKTLKSIELLGTKVLPAIRAL